MTAKNDFERFMRQAHERSRKRVRCSRPEQDSAETTDAPEAPAAATVAVSTESEIDRLAAKRPKLNSTASPACKPSSTTRANARSREQQDFSRIRRRQRHHTTAPILDSLDRALHFEDASAADLHAGVELISKQSSRRLASWGLQVVHAKASLRSAPNTSHRNGRKPRKSRWLRFDELPNRATN